MGGGKDEVGDEVEGGSDDPSAPSPPPLHLVLRPGECARAVEARADVIVVGRDKSEGQGGRAWSGMRWRDAETTRPRRLRLLSTSGRGSSRCAGLLSPARTSSSSSLGEITGSATAGTRTTHTRAVRAIHSRKYTLTTDTACSALQWDVPILLCRSDYVSTQSTAQRSSLTRHGYVDVLRGTSSPCPTTAQRQNGHVLLCISAMFDKIARPYALGFVLTASVTVSGASSRSGASSSASPARTSPLMIGGGMGLLTTASGPLGGPILMVLSVGSMGSTGESVLDGGGCGRRALIKF